MKSTSEDRPGRLKKGLGERSSSGRAKPTKRLSRRTSSVSFNNIPQVLTIKHEPSQEQKKGVLSPRCALPKEHPTTPYASIARATGVSEEEYSRILKTLQKDTKLFQLYQREAPRKRLVSIQSDFTELVYTDKAGKKNVFGKAIYSVTKKKRLLAEVYNVVYAQVPASALRGIKPWLCFSIRFYTDTYGMAGFKLVHFGCNDEQEIETWYLGIQSLAPTTQFHINRAKMQWIRLKLKLRAEAAAKSKSIPDLIDSILATMPRPEQDAPTEKEQRKWEKSRPRSAAPRRLRKSSRKSNTSRPRSSRRSNRSGSRRSPKRSSDKQTGASKSPRNTSVTSTSNRDSKENSRDHSKNKRVGFTEQDDIVPVLILDDSDDSDDAILNPTAPSTARNIPPPTPLRGSKRRNRKKASPRADTDGRRGR